MALRNRVNEIIRTRRGSVLDVVRDRLDRSADRSALRTFQSVTKNAEHLVVLSQGVPTLTDEDRQVFVAMQLATVAPSPTSELVKAVNLELWRVGFSDADPILNSYNKHRSLIGIRNTLVGHTTVDSLRGVVEELVERIGGLPVRASDSLRRYVSADILVALCRHSAEAATNVEHCVARDCAACATTEIIWKCLEKQIGSSLFSKHSLSVANTDQRDDTVSLGLRTLQQILFGCDT